MGAKTIMTVGLRQQASIANLIPIDNSPVDAALKSDFGKYVDGMRVIAAAKPTKQSDADALLQPYESALPIRQFLLTNLVRSKDNSHLEWRIPLKTLAASLDKMADFPFKDPDAARFEGPVLIVRGTQSHYVADEMLPVIGRFFPRFQMSDIDCGHWVVSEKPEEFRRGLCSLSGVAKEYMLTVIQLSLTFSRRRSEGRQCAPRAIINRQTSHCPLTIIGKDGADRCEGPLNQRCDHGLQYLRPIARRIIE